MRTTLTVEDDIARALHELARATGRSFKQVVNDTLRVGLAPQKPAEPYELPVRDLGLRPQVDLTHALRLAGELEDEETVRKLELRK